MLCRLIKRGETVLLLLLCPFVCLHYWTDPEQNRNLIQEVSLTVFTLWEFLDTFVDFSGDSTWMLMNKMSIYNIFN